MITQTELKELLDYNSDTGVFTWKVKRNNRNPVGKQAGTIEKDGYIQIRIFNKSYFAHRLAWLYVTGKWPENQIDHKDGNRSNNCFLNLREADNSINAQNQRKANKRNKLGILGVSKDSTRYKAMIRVKGKRITIGWYKTPEEAHQAYIEVKRKLHLGCTL